VSLRVAFLGNDAWSVPSLEAIAAAPDLVTAIVITNPPRPAGRGSRLRPTPVAERAGELGLDPAQVEGVRTGEGRRALEAARPDVLAVVAYGEILSADLLAASPLGGVNLHFSLLPRWRGAAPVAHAILAGDRTTGVTVMRIDEGLDTGPILRQVTEPIRSDDDAGSLGARLAGIGAPLLVEELGRLRAGTARARPQDERRATLAPKLPPAGREIVWTDGAAEIDRRIRAWAPEPGAATSFHGRRLLIRSASVEPGAPTGAPGELAIAGGLVRVSAGVGVLRVGTVVPAGRPPMSAEAWARGARPAPGDRFG
jgi:methionyl-tRNA formyltransferase